MDADRSAPVQLLLIGGRSAAGKTSVALEVSAQLQALGVAHCHVEGDNLDAAYPKSVDDPQGTKLTEANLRALWRNYAGLGHHRLIYVNTVSVVEPDLIVRAVGGVADVVGVLLTASDETIMRRLAQRESAARRVPQLERSGRMARVLLADAPKGTCRVATDCRMVADVAAEVLRVSGWTEAASGGHT